MATAFDQVRLGRSGMKNCSRRCSHAKCRIDNVGVVRCLGSAIAVLCLMAGCGRFGFDELGDTLADAGSTADGSDETGAALGEACDETLPASSCQPGLTCLLNTCSCLSQLKSDEFQTCSLEPFGQVRCSGGNDNGELGNGSVGGDEPTPATVVAIPPAISFDVGAFHACTRTKSGELWCWGRIDMEAGTGTPYELTTSAPVVEIASGGFHACVLTDDQTVECIGRDTDGQLGQGVVGTTETTFQPVPGLTNVSAIASGGFHSCAIIDGSGDVFCWGANGSGQIGDAVAGGNRPTPTQVVGVSGAVQISAGDFFTCARLADGSVQCWGQNSEGQLGRGAATANEATAAPIVGLPAALDLYVGDDNACVITSANDLGCWGDNTSGQLGFASTAGFEATPATFPAAKPALDVAIGRRHVCVLQSDGAVMCAGQNIRGELGDGTQTSTSDPVESLLSCGP